MDWNMKEASWDLAELDEATGLPNMEETVDGSSRFGSCDRSNRGEFSVDLKLGQVGNSSSSSNEPVAASVVANKWKDVVGGVSKVMMTSSSSSGSSKRARAINNGNQTVSCLVDGCNSDLSNCRDYHRRHKVCELHSKTPVVRIGGHKQRFCQQCSRFHSLEEFDEGKRSCRKRLDGHNRRRRKPPQAAAEGVGGRCGSFLSNYQQGTHRSLLPFSSSHLYPSTAAMVHPGWNTDVRLHHHHHNHLVDHFLGSTPSSSSYTEANNKKQQLAFLQGDHNSAITMENTQSSHQQALPKPPPPAPSVCQTFLRAAPLLPAALLQQDGGDHHHDSHCALSLLSSPQTHTSGSGLSQMVQPHHQQQAISIMQQHQPLGLSLHDHGLETVDPVMVHHGSDHSPTTTYNMNEAPPPFPFHWD
ncbi:hypothetical protein QN277_025693 [Acacia crassicarpa]|uniref:SBP-type domain-containing protein n=1 Tax=Acacia crassicarpa TaxID=499986 RepID=A0AAE1J666_9FABA|nr:hypothetical protein QN277_025693 [Acacia crassicarpa]